MLPRNVFLLVLIPVISVNAYLRLPLTKNRNVNILSNLQALISPNLLNKKIPNKQPVPTVPLWKKNWQYYGNIKIGTPRQEFNVAFETLFSSVLVLASNATAKCKNNHSTFNVSKSHTFTNAGSTEVHDIGPYKRLQTGRDTIEIDGTSVNNHTFDLIIDGDCSNLIPDGVVGLGFQISPNEPTILDRLNESNSIPQYIVSLHLNRDYKTNNGGEIIIGGYESNLVVKDSIRYIPVVPFTTLWEFTVNKVNFGTKEITKNVNAVLDTSISFIGVPKGYIKDIISQTKAIFMQENNTLLVDSTEINHMPSLTFNINGKDYTLNGNDYIDTVDKWTGLSFILMRPIESNEWVLGDVFLAKYYTILDYKNRKVAFAIVNSGFKLVHSWLTSFILAISATYLWKITR